MEYFEFVDIILFKKVDNFRFVSIEEEIVSNGVFFFKILFKFLK